MYATTMETHLWNNIPYVSKEINQYSNSCNSTMIPSLSKFSEVTQEDPFMITLLRSKKRSVSHFAILIRYTVVIVFPGGKHLKEEIFILSSNWLLTVPDSLSLFYSHEARSSYPLSSIPLRFFICNLLKLHVFRTTYIEWICGGNTHQTCAYVGH